MNRQQTILALALLMGAGAAHAQQQEDVDLRTLELMKEEGIPFDEFEVQFAAAPSKTGNYSNFSISDGNYSNFSISSSNYSNFSISSGNYSNFSISSGNYSNFSISGRTPALKTNARMPKPIIKN